MRYLSGIFFLVALFVTGFAPSMVQAAPIVPGSFSTTWDTGVTTSVVIDLGVCPDAVYWEEIGNSANNGTTTVCVGSDQTITFPSPGQYRVDFSGNFTTIDLNPFANKTKFRTVEQWGDSVWTTLASAFDSTPQLSIAASDAPNLSNVTSLRSMFAGAANFNSSIEHWDVSTITDMERMFFNATNFNQPLNNWDVSNVTNMTWMFHGGNFNQPLNNWDVSSVVSFHAMFHRASAFNQDISNWNLASATSIEGMFDNATAFNQSLATWNVSQVNTIRGLFKETSVTPENYSNTIIGWAALPTLQPNVNLETEGIKFTSAAISARQRLITEFNWTIDDGGLFLPPASSTFVTVWDTSLDPLTPNELVFSARGDAAYFNFSIDWGDGTIESFTGSPSTLSHTYATPGIKTVTIEGIFGYFNPECYNGAAYNKLIDVIDWGSASWQNLNFDSCTYLDDFSANGQPDLRAITDLSTMFYGASLFNDNINSWDVSAVRNMRGMFAGAAAFNSPLDQWDVSRVTDMEEMFYNATSFNQDLSTWDVSSVGNMTTMFSGATSFNQDLSTWDVSSVGNMTTMFSGATAFDQDLSSWDISNTFFDWIGFDGTALSTPNYTKLLVAWSQLPITENNSFGEVGPSGNLTPYCSNAQAARDVLENTYGWGDWTDGGPVPCKTATYLTSAGGVLIGDTLQYIVDGTGGTAVTVVPADGYRFISWSDGSIENPRIDSNLTADISVTAILESVDAGSRSNSTAIGVRAERFAEIIANTPVFASITTFIASVRDFLDYLTIHEDELETLPAEERNRIIISLRDIIAFLLKFVPAGE